MWPTVPPRARGPTLDARARRLQALVLQHVGELRLRALRVRWPPLYATGLHYGDRDRIHVLRMEGTLGHMMRPPTPPGPSWRDPGYSWLPADYRQMPSLPPYVAPADPAPPPPSVAQTMRVREGLVLALLIVIGFTLFIIKKAENYIYNYCVKSARRASDDWPATNVLATTLSERLPAAAEPEVRFFPSGLSQDSLAIDLPPPYSECANIGPNADIGTDTANFGDRPEQPPPYTYVAFDKQADEIPSVHYSNQNERLTIDTGQEHMERHDQKSFADKDANAGPSNVNGCENTKLVFENGRIVERYEYIANNVAQEVSQEADDFKVRDSGKPQNA